MRSLRRVALALLVGALLRVAASTAAAAKAPQSCSGQVVTSMNQFNGAFGARGNPQAAAGLGVYFGSQTSAGIAALREEICN